MRDRLLDAGVAWGDAASGAVFRTGHLAPTFAAADVVPFERFPYNGYDVFEPPIDFDRWALGVGGAVLVLLVAGWMVAASAGRTAALRSRHGEPATTAPPSLVAVTAQGKLYHRPEGSFLHGPVRMAPGEQAIAEGYAPCTRCKR